MRECPIQSRRQMEGTTEVSLDYDKKGRNIGSTHWLLCSISNLWLPSMTRTWPMKRVIDDYQVEQILGDKWI